MTRFLVVAALIVTASIDAAVVPTRIPFEGQLLMSDGAPRRTPATLVISLYGSREATEPLWSEEQDVTPDENGKYAISIGAIHEEGIPATVFVSSAARWVGVGVRGEAEQPRFMLISAPYAAKALDAESIGGKRAAEFVLVENLREQIRVALAAEANSTLPDRANPRGLESQMRPSLPQRRDVQPDHTAGFFENRRTTGLMAGVLGTALSSEHGTPDDGVTGVLGMIMRTGTSGVYSAGVRGVHYGESGNGVGVIGHHTGWGFGVFGDSYEGVGVVGRASRPAGVGVRAVYSGTGAGTALEVQNGAIRLTGTTRAAFVHEVLEGNITLDSTIIDHPLSNGDPNAILIVTPRRNAPACLHVCELQTFTIRYRTAIGAWEIVKGRGTDGVDMAWHLHAQFNVLVIKQ